MAAQPVETSWELGKAIQLCEGHVVKDQEQDVDFLDHRRVGVGVGADSLSGFALEAF